MDKIHPAQENHIVIGINVSDYLYAGIRTRLFFIVAVTGRVGIGSAVEDLMFHTYADIPSLNC